MLTLGQWAVTLGITTGGLDRASTRRDPTLSRSRSEFYSDV